MGQRGELISIVRWSSLCVLEATILICGFTPLTSAQPQRQQLILAVKENCAKTRTPFTEVQLPNWQRRKTALDILLADWKEKMPPHLRENLPIQLQDGLNVEIVALQKLAASYDALQPMLKACAVITEQITPEMIAPLAATASQLHAQLNQLRERWAGSPSRKTEFKAALDRAVGLMIQYNSSKASTYIAMKSNLDPDILDQLITHQITLVTNVETGFSLLK